MGDKKNKKYNSNFSLNFSSLLILLILILIIIYAFINFCISINKKDNLRKANLEKMNESIIKTFNEDIEKIESKEKFIKNEQKNGFIVECKKLKYNIEEKKYKTTKNFFYCTENLSKYINNDFSILHTKNNETPKTINVFLVEVNEKINIVISDDENYVILGEFNEKDIYRQFSEIYLDNKNNVKNIKSKEYNLNDEITVSEYNLNNKIITKISNGNKNTYISSELYRINEESIKKE